MSDFQLSCVLFDLDGTLVDTAPDLLACCQQALTQYGFTPAPAAQLRPFISYGAAAMIEASVTDTASESQRSDILTTMLTLYQNNIAKHSIFFDGMLEVLATIEQRGLKWGVVTNKRQRFTQPLMDALELTHRAACIISGDTTENPKPHPAPMFAACARVGVEPQHCVYIGDAQHDIIAGKNAQMKTIAALYGYLKADDTPHLWGADALITAPTQLLTWMDTCH
jgi:phosphoglycolate phosphatase